MVASAAERAEIARLLMDSLNLGAPHRRAAAAAMIQRSRMLL
jgi:hypothetical protein